MTPADITALRILLARARAAGWTHVIYDTLGDREHVWRRNADGADQRTSLYAGFVSFDSNRNDPAARNWTVPAESIAQMAAVLEIAGVLPPVDRTELIRRAIADPDQFTPRTYGRDCVYTNCTCEPEPAWTARAVAIALGGVR